MFSGLSERLNNIFSKITSRGVLSEDDVNSAMREIRVALLEADVALPVVKDFINKVKEEAVGEKVYKSISPGQMVIKIVNDHLENFLKAENSELNLKTAPPAVILMLGLQGSGKTTTSAKLAKLLKNKQNKKILLSSLDIYRPKAQEQLSILAKQINVDAMPISNDKKVIDICRDSLAKAREENYDILILDTAGRLHIDDELMNELIAVSEHTQPVEKLLVADSLTGQDAVNIAKEFNEKVGITGIILTRIDGDSRGGAALSMKHVTNCPIKFLGSGEKLDELEEFHADRIASRILGMGDIVSLVEQAAENIDEAKAESMMKKMQKGNFDYNDLLQQFKTMRKMGGFGKILGMLPGMGNMMQQLEGNVDEKMIDRQEAIILSMTKKERKNPDLINGSRRRRIAAGSGVDIQDVNKLIKQYKTMKSMMKKFSKMDKKSLMKGGLGNLLPKFK